MAVRKEILDFILAERKPDTSDTLPTHAYYLSEVIGFFVESEAQIKTFRKLLNEDGSEYPFRGMYIETLLDVSKKIGKVKRYVLNGNIGADRLYSELINLKPLTRDLQQEAKLKGYNPFAEICGYIISTIDDMERWKRNTLIHNTGKPGTAGQTGEAGQEPGTDTQPPLQSITTKLTDAQAKQLLTELVEKGYISETTTNDNWLATFGFTAFPENFSRIVWIKKTLPNKQPNKRSLLFLLDLIGCKEKDVRERINQLFVVQDAITEFNDKNDFNEFYRPRDSVRAALRNKNSQFASDLSDIKDKALQPKES